MCIYNGKYQYNLLRFARKSKRGEYSGYHRNGCIVYMYSFDSAKIESFACEYYNFAFDQLEAQTVISTSRGCSCDVTAAILLSLK